MLKTTPRLSFARSSPAGALTIEKPNTSVAQASCQGGRRDRRCAVVGRQRSFACSRVRREEISTAARVGAAAGAAHGRAYSPEHAYNFRPERVLDGLPRLLTAAPEPFRMRGRHSAARVWELLDEAQVVSGRQNPNRCPNGSGSANQPQAPSVSELAVPESVAWLTGVSQVRRSEHPAESSYLMLSKIVTAVGLSSPTPMSTGSSRIITPS